MSYNCICSKWISAPKNCVRLGIANARKRFKHLVSCIGFRSNNFLMTRPLQMRLRAVRHNFGYYMSHTSVRSLALFAWTWPSWTFFNGLFGENFSRFWRKLTSAKPIIRRMRCEQIGNIRDEAWNLESLFECRAKLYWHKRYKGSLTVGETPENPNLICTLTFHHTKSCSKLYLRS